MRCKSNNFGLYESKTERSQNRSEAQEPEGRRKREWIKILHDGYMVWLDNDEIGGEFAM